MRILIVMLLMVPCLFAAQDCERLEERGRTILTDEGASRGGVTDIFGDGWVASQSHVQILPCILKNIIVYLAYLDCHRNAEGKDNRYTADETPVHCSIDGEEFMMLWAEVQMNKILGRILKWKLNYRERAVIVGVIKGGNAYQKSKLLTTMIGYDPFAFVSLWGWEDVN